MVAVLFAVAVAAFGMVGFADDLPGLATRCVAAGPARLGLRGAEATGLQLGGIDWRAGEVAITGKGSQVERLPLSAQRGKRLPGG